MNQLDNDKNEQWMESLKLMQGLFPKWNVTTEQLESWKLEFGMLNPVWFREALRVVYGRYNADNPKPKWVKEAFKEVKAGHQGIPLNESDAQSNKLDEEQKEWDAHVKVVERDRHNAWHHVMKWSDKEKTEWATKFVERFNMLSERNDLSNFNTWSQTFCQQVMIYRKRFGNATS